MCIYIQVYMYTCVHTYLYIHDIYTNVHSLHSTVALDPKYRLQQQISGSSATVSGSSDHCVGVENIGVECHCDIMNKNRLQRQIYTYISVYLYIHIHICIYLHVYVLIYVYICTYTYVTYIQICTAYTAQWHSTPTTNIFLGITPMESSD